PTTEVHDRLSGYAGTSGTGGVQLLSEVKKETYARFTTGLNELDRVLGGGLVFGSVVLIGGDPGIGKSTILLQTLIHLSHTGKNVLYVTGEESPSQVALRAERLQLDGSKLQLLSETNVEKILRVAEPMKLDRSEEHTSELQSRFDLVCCL